jgi:hydrogenase/urease accessory protein HupE
VTSLRNLFLITLVLLSASAYAHDVRPGYLRIQHVDGERYSFLWRSPGGDENPLDLSIELPGHCAQEGDTQAWQQNRVNIERWKSVCPGGLIDHAVTVNGLAGSLTDVLARFERPDGTTQVVRLTSSSPSFIITGTDSWQETAYAYASLGMQHILLGVDHLLFVLALLIIVSGWRSLVATITSFTVAHSVTLALATLGFVNLPQAPIEAVIALSIVLIAAEIVHQRRGREGLTYRKPWLVAFVFGLLHGLGFAGALSEIGLPENAIPLALLFFNIGVEAGQLLFVAAVVTAVAISGHIKWPAWAWRVPVYGIGSLAGFWTVQRVVGF